jgi:protein-S-isoprenylcysteine O-methyltransferase Ste14
VADTPNSPGVNFPPPLLFVAGLALSWWLNRQMPFAIWDERSLRLLLGWFVLLQGFVILATGLATLFLNRTAIYPNQPASRLVETGPYRFTRNPMYLALVISYIGLALLSNMLWALIVLPAVIFALYYTVIRREERYLQQAFGSAYTDYCRRVRRWC